MDGKAFMEAIDAIEAQKGISKQSIIDALSEALKKAYIREIDGDEEARVEVTINEKEINMTITKEVVEEVIIDYLEISLEDAKKINKKAKVGEDVTLNVDVDSLRRITANAVKSILRQKLAEAEKQVLYEQNKDKINEMITGVVDRCDDRGAVVVVGRTSLFLSRRDLIGDETFEHGAPIRMFVANVSNNEKGAMIKVSRSDPGFLRRLFEEEVPDIYNGTVIIKGLAREAGIRSKLAVYSNDPNVDCVGSCIGVNGVAIKKIVDQLGNTRDKEKIDIIPFSKNEGLFIVDALRPATVTYIHLNEELDEDGKKKAVAIVKDDQLSLAIGRRGANARLACRLTGWSIDIHEEKEMANLSDISFKSVEELKEEDKLQAKKEMYENYLAQVKSNRAKEEVKEDLTTGLQKSKPQQILDDDIAEEKPAVEEVKSVEEKQAVEEKPAVEPKVSVVKTTTTLESLEASLEEDKKKESFKATHKTSKRPHLISEEEQPHEKVEDKVSNEKKGPQMDIYTKEELEDLENEDFDEEIFEDEDIDYDEYDKYYEDSEK